jgi:chromate transporter
MKYDALRAHWREVVSGFLKIGAMSYGGPAIMGLMQTEFQEKRGWLSKERFLEGLAMVALLPGAGATQLGIFLGHARAGWWGGLLAGLCFVLPAFFIMLALTLVYSEYGALPYVRDMFYGLAPVVVGIFIVAVVRLGRTAVGDSRQALLAVGAALLAEFSPFGIVATLLLAGCLGVALYHRRDAGLAAAVALTAIYVAVRMSGGVIEPAALVLDQRGTVGIGDIALFFFGVGAFSFGGGLSMLAFMQEQVVNQMHWLTAREFLDGLALGQLTPGPILMVAAFVGYKLAGIAGALAAAAAIFLPSFLLMLALLPWVARIKQWQWMRAALKGVVPAVIGVLAIALGGMLPAAATDVFTALIVIVTVLVLLVWRVGPLPPMFAGAVAGFVARLVR